VHFPYPTGEIAADIVLGKIDAVEIWPQDDPKVHPKLIEEFDSLRYLDWYHYLNCGYRPPAVSGTDKMGAYMPAGTNRVYAYLGQEEFNFPNFARAVRAGNTFATSGPLLMFYADGHAPGAEITLGAGGGTIEVTADAQCFVPIHRPEVVFNGKVVAFRDEPAAVRTIYLTEKIKVHGPGWLRDVLRSRVPRPCGDLRLLRTPRRCMRMLRGGTCFRLRPRPTSSSSSTVRRCMSRRSPRGRMWRPLAGFAKSILTPARNCTAACTSTGFPWRIRFGEGRPYIHVLSLKAWHPPQ
jgi:hypothetical protein